LDKLTIIAASVIPYKAGEFSSNIILVNHLNKILSSVCTSVIS
jgi:hypothetical protein